MAKAKNCIGEVRTLSKLETIELLCALVEHQASVIGQLSVQLAEMRNLTDAEQRMIESAKEKYASLLGAVEEM